jgi:hypothetical protein
MTRGSKPEPVTRRPAGGVVSAAETPPRHARNVARERELLLAG